MLALLLSMAGLGLAAIDPIGIGLILLLLVQKNPIRRCAIFLSGSVSALLLIGYLFARGLGVLILRTEDAHHWLGPSFQLVAGALLLVFAVFTLMSKAGEETKQFDRYIHTKDVFLFLFGFTLVIAQSIIDVVFLVAMTHVARMHLSNTRLFAAILTYTFAALWLQGVIVLVYLLAPKENRKKIIGRSQKLLDKYGQQVTVGLGVLLGIALCINGLLMALSKPHL